MGSLSKEEGTIVLQDKYSGFLTAEHIELVAFSSENILW